MKRKTTIGNKVTKEKYQYNSDLFRNVVTGDIRSHEINSCHNCNNL